MPHGYRYHEFHRLPMPEQSSCWECPKCGDVLWKDLKVVEVNSELRLQHNCGNLCRVRPYNSEFRKRRS